MQLTLTARSSPALVEDLLTVQIGYRFMHSYAALLRLLAFDLILDGIDPRDIAALHEAARVVDRILPRCAATQSPHERAGGGDRSAVRRLVDCTSATTWRDMDFESWGQQRAAL